MSKYCFVIIESLNRAPYLAKYLEVLKEDYDIIVWDRSGNSNNPGAANFYTMDYKQGKNLNYFDKFVGYLKFAKFASRILKKSDYKGAFVFTPNVGILCNRVLIRKYKKRFVLDVRDYWKEKNKLIYLMEKGLVKNSFANVISSRAYKTFLPKSEYIVTHNSQIIDEKLMNHFRSQRISPKNKIVVACIGGVKYIEYDKKVIDYFANDDRFFLQYIGKGYDQLGNYCVNHHIGNVYVEGMFPMNETFDKYENVDMILNMYGNHTPKLDYALSNKLYFAAQLGKPIVVCKDTYMEEVSVGNGFGISIDLNDQDGKEKLYRYFNSINYDEFVKNCDSFLNSVEEDESNFEQMINSFVTFTDI